MFWNCPPKKYFNSYQQTIRDPMLSKSIFYLKKIFNSYMKYNFGIFALINFFSMPFACILTRYLSFYL